MDDDKRRAARVLEEIASLLELAGENPFRVRAYEEGARAVRGLEGTLAEALRSVGTAGVKGIGKGLQQELAAFVETGTTPLNEQLRARYPGSLRELLRVPGIGPKKVRAVFEGLGVTDVDALAEAGRLGRLARLKGFGPKTQEKILRGLAFYQAHRGLFLLAEVQGEAARIARAIRGLPGVTRCEVAGSVRRRVELVRNVDLVAAAPLPEEVVAAFVALPFVTEVLAREPARATVRADGGLPVELHAVVEEEFPFALLWLTGSAEHRELLRRRADSRGLELTDRGLFRKEDDRPVPCRDEEAVYAELGLAAIPPELREGSGGEIELAERGALPNLVAREDLRGIFHDHTVASDGCSTLEAMVEAARRLGFEYIGISDHSKAAAYAGGLDDARLRAQHAAIDALNSRQPGIRVLKGVEADILRDGGIDLAPETLAGCDFVVASIHSRFGEDREAMTRRICRALESPFVTMLGHVSGRLLLERGPYDLDYDRVFQAAAEHGVLIEINADPRRLDLDWRLIPRAKAAGVRFAINPDAHDAGALSYARDLGVGVARKGLLEPGDVVNTVPVAEMLRYLGERKERMLAGPHSH